VKDLKDETDDLQSSDRGYRDLGQREKLLKTLLKVRCAVICSAFISMASGLTNVYCSKSIIFSVKNVVGNINVNAILFNRFLQLIPGAA